MKKIIILTLLILSSLSIYAQGDGGGGSNGGPGIILKSWNNNILDTGTRVDGEIRLPKISLDRFLDRNGNWQQIEDLNQGIEREYDHMTVLKGVLDINTRDHGLIDTETLRDLSPQWMEERNGEIWVDPRAPITDYQTSDGEIKPF